MSDDEQDTVDAQWSQAELEQQQRLREELIECCKREPLDPMLLPSWTQSSDPF